MDFDQDLDAVGLLCPLPVLKARKRLQSMETGQVLRVCANDPAAIIDIPHFCNEQGHIFLGSSTQGDETRYFIRKT